MMKKIVLTCIITLLSLTGLNAKERSVIAVETDSKGLYLIAEPNGVLRQCYFGERLQDPTELYDSYGAVTSSTDYLRRDSAYPTFGTGNLVDAALKLTHADGNMTTRLIFQASVTESPEDANVVETTIYLKDEYYPLYVTLHYKAYQKEDVLVSSVTVRNEEESEVNILGISSSYLGIKAQDYYLTRFYGSWAKEMQMVENKLEDGSTVIDSKLGVRTTQDGSPSFILSLDQKASETEGEVIMGSLAWSGNYKINLEIDNTNKMNIFAGVNDYLSSYKLSPKESFTTPEFVFTHSDKGTGEGSRNLHSWVRNYNIRQGDMERPVVLNSWEGAYFSFDDDVIMKMIDDAALMGIEIFVLDDGWFGTTYPRDHDRAGLGDWQENREKLKGGLAGLIEHTKEKGIRFGLWVEPEMVNPESELANNHPEWIVKSPNRESITARNQLLLDMTNPEVQDFTYHVVADILNTHSDIAYIKWDANRHVEDFGSTYLATDKQSHFWIDYINGLYSVYAKLAEEFPNVVFQACSSGGGRVDYGSMKYHHEVWGSDNTDAESRIFINWGMNYFFPSMAIGSHVSQSPNHQTGHISPIKFRFDVAMAERLGAELQPKNLTEEELEWTKVGIEEYKRIRPVIQLGDQYRLISPYSDSGFASLMYTTQEKDRAVVFAYSIKYNQSAVKVKLQGLDPEKRYSIKELMPTINSYNKQPKYAYKEGETIHTGDFLMKHGITLSITRRYDSAVLELTAVE